MLIDFSRLGDKRYAKLPGWAEKEQEERRGREKRDAITGLHELGEMQFWPQNDEKGASGDASLSM